MRIRLQILLGVAPVFLVLGLVVAVLNFTTRREEVRLALREEVFTLAVALSEFLGSDTLASNLAESKADQSQLRVRLERVMEENAIERIVLRSLDASRPPLKLGEGDSALGISTNPQTVFEARGEVLFSPVLEDPDGQSFVRAMTPLKTGAGPFGLLVLDVDAASASQSQRTILLHSLAFLIGILGSGILVSLVVARLVSGAAQQLSEATDVVASGRYDWHVRPGWLREFNDLGNTFNTMTSLLEEILSKTKRAVIEGEQFRRPEDLAEAFSEALWSLGHSRLGDLDVSLMRLGGAGNGDFLALWEDADGARIAMGRVLVSGELETAVVASAAFALIREEIRVGGPGFSRAGEIYHFKYWDLVLWERSHPAVDVWTYHFGQMEPERRRVTFEEGRALALHSLEGEWARRLELYLGMLDGMDGNARVRELTRILNLPAGGGVILFTPRSV